MTKRQYGFTLVELMIATTVFSVVMLISTYAFLRINNYYTRGINNARVQSAIRNTVADIGQQLQFTPALLQTDGSTLYCMGNTSSYKFQIGEPENGNGTALYKSQINVPAGCSSPGTDKRVLLPKNTRLTVFSIVPSGVNNSMYTITMSVITAPVDAAGGDKQSDIIVGDSSVPSTWRCPDSSNDGGKYCAYNSVSTTVFRRVTN